MSTTDSRGVKPALGGCRPAAVEPVVVDAADLESTATEYLRELESGLAERGYQPAALAVDACFADDCPLATEAEADRLRGFVRAATLLGAGRIEVGGDFVDDVETAETTLSALAERARREGIELVRASEADHIGDNNDDGGI